jgi:hypothetical protein
MQVNGQFINSYNKKVRRERTTLANPTFRAEGGQRLTIYQHNKGGRRNASMDEIDEMLTVLLAP